MLGVVGRYNTISIQLMYMMIQVDGLQMPVYFICLHGHKYCFLSSLFRFLTRISMISGVDLEAKFSSELGL